MARRAVAGTRGAGEALTAGAVGANDGAFPPVRPPTAPDELPAAGNGTETLPGDPAVLIRPWLVALVVPPRGLPPEPFWPEVPEAPVGVGRGLGLGCGLALGCGVEEGVAGAADTTTVPAALDTSVLPV